MLAPRKKLWSTPTAAINVAARLIQLTADDTMYDVGCGDGRVIIGLASTSPCRKFVGIEIDEERAREAEANVGRARRDGQIPEGTSITIRRENAMEVDYSQATAVFLYLVPRGLKLLKPILLLANDQSENEKGGDSSADRSSSQKRTSIRVVTYMSGFADESYVKKETCTVDHQEGAAWPIYLYHLERNPL